MEYGEVNQKSHGLFFIMGISLSFDITYAMVAYGLRGRVGADAIVKRHMAVAKRSVKGLRLLAIHVSLDQCRTLTAAHGAGFHHSTCSA